MRRETSPTSASQTDGGQMEADLTQHPFQGNLVGFKDGPVQC